MKKINNMKTVIISTRAVYHKIAEVTVDVPDNIEENEIQDWIWNNEHLFVEELDTKLHAAPLEYGLGVGDVFDEIESDYETRFDFVVNDEIIFGGHC